MLEKYARPLYQRLLVDPIIEKMEVLLFLRPIHLTIFGCLLGILGAYLMGLGKTLMGLSLIFLSGYFDTLDGSLARHKHQTTPFGTALDIVCDRTVEFAVILGFFKLYGEGYLSLLMLGSILICVTSFLVVGIFSENSTQKSFYYSPGLIERGEAFLFFGLMACLPMFFSVLAAIFSLAVFLTAAIRLIQFYRQLNLGKNVID